MQHHFVPRESALWHEGAALVGAVYKARYGARIPDFAPEMAVVTSGAPSGRVLCAAGIRTARTGFFSQIYLDRPLTEMLNGQAPRKARPVRDDDLFEIVTLASRHPVATLAMFAAILARGRARGKSWGVFTLTAPLAQLIEHAGVPLLRLAPARAERLANPAAWGRYYQADPWVCAVAGNAATGLLQHRAIMACAAGRPPRATRRGRA